MPGSGRVRTIVVDDEKPARMRVLDLLRRMPEIEVVGTAADGEEALTLIRAKKPDLLLLDVQMPRRDGFGVLHQLGPDVVPVTVFVTAYDHHAVRAFDAHAVDYVLKPFSDERFERAIRHARRYLGTQEAHERSAELAAAVQERESVNARSGFLERLVLKSGASVMFLSVADLDWIEAAGVYVNLHVGPKVHLYRSSVAQLLERLDPGVFVRIHRSAAVNVSRIRELRSRSHGDFTVVLKDGSRLGMSRGYRANLESWLRQRL